MEGEFASYDNFASLCKFRPTDFPLRLVHDLHSNFDRGSAQLYKFRPTALYTRDIYYVRDEIQFPRRNSKARQFRKSLPEINTHKL